MRIAFFAGWSAVRAHADLKNNSFFHSRFLCFRDVQIDLKDQSVKHCSVNQSLKQSVNHDDQSFDQTVSQTFRKHLRRWKLIHCKHCTIEPLQDYPRTSFSSCIFHQNNSQFFNEIVTHQDVDNQNEKINFKSYARALIRKTKALN